LVSVHALTTKGPPVAAGKERSRSRARLVWPDRPGQTLDMRICVIAGGVGSARFCAGLVRVVDPSDVTIVVNTGDDERMRGLHVSPDVDTVLYHLAGLTDWDRGWGATGESYRAHDRYVELVSRVGDVAVDMHEWFTLGDVDLATNMLRSRLLDAGKTLTEATDALRRGLGVQACVLPMSNEPVRTMLRTSGGEVLDFQTYFVRRSHSDEITGVEFAGIADASPAPGVLEAIAGADLVLIPPSNPIVSIAPVLAFRGIRDAAAAVRTRVAVSPIVGGKALKGPADMLMRSLGHDQTAVGVARIYKDAVDVFVLDEADAALSPDVEALGLRAVVVDTIMSSPEASASVAKAVLASV
jgi:LPPG:FO 2-phospho-L-lactate transferase